MRILGPVLDRATYRRWTYFILGGALLVPYLLLASVLAPSLLPVVTSFGYALPIGGGLALVVMAASSLIPAVRVLEGAAIREMLDDPVPDATFGKGTGRVRMAAMFMAHVLVGGVVSLLSLALPVLLAFSVAGLFTGELSIGTGPDTTKVQKGWAGTWLPALLFVSLIALIYLVWAAGGMLAKAARRLFDVTAAERIAQLERRAGQLAERNRLARELHDSVGHALSVVTIQAGAARRTLRTDLEFTEKALEAIEESARSALDDLDHVLGLLREESRQTRTPQAGLAELPSLLQATGLAGIDVEADLRGDLTAVPPVVSREAYRIVQECLTNVLRHAGKVPVGLVVDAAPGRLEITVGNPLGAAEPGARRSGGRGLRGIAERVEVLRGEFTAGREGDRWEVRVRLAW
ncbi:sensor histidine kinase [Amycolatopsis sp. cg5]|uniref:sensor histidine kinase n=1 Tax=Amycolatopsis sp. cg5 TaxID=3238802 RepID=UPI0035266D50